MDFVGKICPYCKAVFNEGDDIVVCSICEMPHHKDCWIENKACTTFGCTGTIMGADNYNESLNQKLFCKKCGSPYTETQKFCTSCGAAVANPVEQPQYAHAQAQQYTTSQQSQYSAQQYAQPSPNSGYNQYNQINMDIDMQAFIGKNQYYYIPKFQKLNSTNSTSSWNWASAFFGAYWFAYRKMYKIAAAYCAISILSALIPTLSSFSSTALFVLSGMFGNYFYKQYAESEVQVAKSLMPNMKQNHIMNKGGTSAGAVWVLIGIITLLVIIFILIASTY